MKLILWLLAAVLSIAALLIAVQGYWILTRTTEQDVRQLVSNNLKLGSSSEDIFHFLDEHGFEHSAIREAGPTTVLEEAGYPASTRIISAGRDNTSRTWISTGQVAIYFILDASDRLQSYIVEESFTSF